MPVNTFILGLLATFIRYGVVALAGTLGLGPALEAFIKGDPQKWTQLSLSIATVLATILYALYKKFLDKQKLLQVLAEAGMTERGVESLVKSNDIPTPSVLTPKTQVPG